MRRFFADLNPMLRGFVLIAAIALVIVLLKLQLTLVALFVIARIAFALAIAFFVFLMWRERREEIGDWGARPRVVFYGAALLIVVDIGAYTLRGASGLDALAFVLVLALSGFAMWRVWRGQHTYA
jgi:small-conductance mechanosensitive channel